MFDFMHEKNVLWSNAIASKQTPQFLTLKSFVSAQSVSCLIDCVSVAEAVDEQLFSEELIWGGFSPLAPPYSGLGFTITFLQLYSEFLCRQWSTSRDPHGVYLSHEALKKKPVFLFWFFFFTCCCLVLLHLSSIWKAGKHL